MTRTDTAHIIAVLYMILFTVADDGWFKPVAGILTLIAYAVLMLTLYNEYLVNKLKERKR